MDAIPQKVPSKKRGGSEGDGVCYGQIFAGPITLNSYVFLANFIFGNGRKTCWLWPWVLWATHLRYRVFKKVLLAAPERQLHLVMPLATLCVQNIL